MKTQAPTLFQLWTIAVIKNLFSAIQFYKINWWLLSCCFFLFIDMQRISKNAESKTSRNFSIITTPVCAIPFFQQHLPILFIRKPYAL